VAVAFVQKGDSGVAPGIASGVAGNILPTNATVGNCVLVAIVPNTTEAANSYSVTSPMGTFVKLGSSANSGYDIEYWGLLGVPTASRAITVTTTAGRTWYGQGTEFSNVGSLLAAVIKTGTSTAPSSSAVTVPAGGAIIAGISTAGTISAAPLSPWVDYNAGAFIFADGADTAYQVPASGGSLTATWTTGSAAWDVIAIVLVQAVVPFTQGRMFLGF
jgi:hypothetical protein